MLQWIRDVVGLHDVATQSRDCDARPLLCSGVGEVNAVVGKSREQLRRGLPHRIGAYAARLVDRPSRQLPIGDTSLRILGFRGSASQRGQCPAADQNGYLKHAHAVTDHHEARDAHPVDAA